MNFRWGLLIVFGVPGAINFACTKKYIEIVPSIYGHAGLSLSPERAVFPPNSEKAIFYGLDALNADGAEVDIQMTKDSVLVLFHDPFLNLPENEPSCVGNYSWNELHKLGEDNGVSFLRLEDIAPAVLDRNKLLCLDVKHYDYCTESYIDFTAFDYALKKALDNISDQGKKNITVNTRNITLLASITDTLIQKSFETEEILLGIEYHNLLGIDKITTKLSALTAEEAKLMKNESLPFCLYQVKSKAEIKAAASLQPNEIVTDNIAATKKYYR